MGRGPACAAGGKAEAGAEFTVDGVPLVGAFAERPATEPPR
ncbi:hypothetical protein Amir_3780 [Actinosynnema mirum DSM 43827]|uniref:Uncharacterized protein n=1 Tax=Actinosynnema mirum (strain ATCC 29888 / DSM 43827 / JCM 3225 / NBRC 14064 / NCIMB 13271 / NRRL B-12336 / IMRU 3971 / 101) TaxID=446462 RepID=C6WD42_ACTMD|nr:hypothetical protein Amir_3780 [Actinosynnema mirum DSM 43827]